MHKQKMKTENREEISKIFMMKALASVVSSQQLRYLMPITSVFINFCKSTRRRSIGIHTYNRHFSV